MMIRIVLTVVLAAAVTLSGVGRVGAGQLETFKVRGHWVLEVLNPDGSLASRQEFDNALINGKIAMAQLLARKKVMSEWFISLMTTGAGNVSPFSGTPLGPALPEFGLIAEPTNAFPQLDGALFKTLQVDSVDTTGIVELHGSATAQRAGVITAVQTYASLCPAATPSCPTVPPPVPGHNMVDFSGKLVTQALVPKQIVQVTVTYSFSSASSTTTQ